MPGPATSFDVTVFRDCRDHSGRAVTLTWPELVKHLEYRDERADKDGPLLCGFRFAGTKSNDNAQRCSLLLLDFDHENLGKTADILETWLPVRHVAYSTHRWAEFAKQDIGRIRLVIALSRPVTVEEYYHIWDALFESFPGLDRKTRPCHMAAYTPSCPMGESGEAWCYSCDGQPLDVEAFLEIPVAAHVAKPRTEPRVDRAAIELAGSVVTAARFRAVCRKLARRDIPEAEAFESLKQGLPFAEPGNRDEVLFKVLCRLAKEFPSADPTSLASHFGCSCSAMQLLAPGAPDLATVAYKFSRAIIRIRQEESEGPGFICSSTGSAIPSTENVRRALEHGAPAKLALDDFASRVRLMSRPPWDEDMATEYPRDLRDSDLVGCSDWLLSEYRLNVRSTVVFEAVTRMAECNRYHPVREWLRSLQWDGTPRLDTWLIRHLGCADVPTTRWAGAWWAMQAVARIMQPGCQADYTLVLEGPQGRRKSTALRALVEGTTQSGWFTDQICGEVGSKEAKEGLQGKWVVELSELAATRRADQESLKLFLTSQRDRFRVPFSKVALDFPRQCTFAGSTNESEYLQDSTGGRRYWPVAIGDADIRLSAILEEREQLWAEAVARYDAGEKYWPESEREKIAMGAEVAKRRMGDSWEDTLEDWLAAPVCYSSGDAEGTGKTRLSTSYFLGTVMKLERSSKADDARMVQALKCVGFVKANGGRTWLPPATFKSPPVAVKGRLRAV
jgi:predicted P-loop ATPase